MLLVFLKTHYGRWAGVFLLILLAHVSYFNNGFTWLDHGDIEQKRAVVAIGNLPKAFAMRFGETGFYRPLVTLVHSVDAAMYGIWVPGFHVTNVLLHVLVTGAFALFLGQFLSLRSSAVQIAVLSAGVHPLSYLPVGAISYRPELLAVLFVFLTLFFHAKARQAGLARDTLCAGFCVLLACFAKESAPVWIIGLVVVWEMTSPKDRVSKTVFLGELLAVIGYVGLRFWAVPDMWHLEHAPLTFGQAIGTRLASVGILMGSLVLPLQSALSDATPIYGFTHPLALITGFGVLAGGWGMMRLGIRSPWTPILLFIGVALSPALNLVPLPRFRSPHYAYLATFGLGMVIGLIFQIAERKKKVIRMPVRLALVLWLLVATATTVLAGGRFKNDQTLFEPDVRQDPHFLEGHFYLGDYYKQKGQMDRAADSYLLALNVDPTVLAYVDATAVLINLAEIRLIQGRVEAADKLLVNAVEGAGPSQKSLIAYNRALIASQQGQNDRVVGLLTASGVYWNRPEPFLILAQAQKHLGQTEDAIQTLRRALPFLNEKQKRQIETLIRNTAP